MKNEFSTLGVFLLSPVVYGVVIIIVPVLVTYRIIEAVLKS